MFNGIVRWFTQPSMSNFEYLVCLMAVLYFRAADTILEFLIVLLIVVSVSAINKILFNTVSEEKHNDA